MFLNMLLCLVLITFRFAESLKFGDPDEDYPWFLALQERTNSSTDDWKHFCTAVVLSEKYHLVILPAHCLYKRPQNGQNIKFVAGEWSQRKWKMLHMGKHLGPTYFGKWWTDDYKNTGDLCIVQLDDWYSGLKVLPRPDSRFYLIPYVSNCYAFGNKPGQTVYFRREVVKLTIVPQERCIYEWGDLARNDSKICVVNKSGEPCPGDPGSILVCDDPHIPLSYHLIGFSATGPNFCGTDTISALYTNILSYRDWIHMIYTAYSKHLPAKD